MSALLIHGTGDDVESGKFYDIRHKFYNIHCMVSAALRNKSSNGDHDIQIKDILVLLEYIIKTIFNNILCYLARVQQIFVYTLQGCLSETLTTSCPHCTKGWLNNFVIGSSLTFISVDDVSTFKQFDHTIFA